MSQDDSRVIIDGPSKFDLMVSLFDGTTESQKVLVFRLDNQRILNIRITSLQREDGSGENWIFQGFTNHYPRPYAEEQHVNGFFSTQNRKGRLTIG